MFFRIVYLISNALLFLARDLPWQRKSQCTLWTLLRMYDMFVNWNWVDSRWQQYSTHLHTNKT